MWHGYGFIAYRWWDPDLSYTWIPYKETMKTDTVIFGLLRMSTISAEGKGFYSQ